MRFRDTTPVQVQINTVAPGMVAEEIERQITFPVELAMGGMPGLEGLRSASMFGLSVVIVTFRDAPTSTSARQLINERLGTVSVPSGVELPRWAGFHGLGRGVPLFARAPRHEPDGCEDAPGMDAQARPAERAGRGGSERLGRPEQAVSDSDRPRPAPQIRPLRSTRSWTRCHATISTSAAARSTVRDAVLVYGVGRTVDIEQIQRIVIASSGGVPIRIRDVGEVVIGHEIRKGAVDLRRRRGSGARPGLHAHGREQLRRHHPPATASRKLLDTLPDGVEAKWSTTASSSSIA